MVFAHKYVLGDNRHWLVSSRGPRQVGLGLLLPVGMRTNVTSRLPQR